MFCLTFVCINQDNMENILIYIAKCSLCLAAFYLPFRWFLRKETNFRFNRWTLLGITLLSFLLPLINTAWIVSQLGYEDTSLISQITLWFCELTPLIKIYTKRVGRIPLLCQLFRIVKSNYLTNYLLTFQIWIFFRFRWWINLIDAVLTVP